MGRTPLCHALFISCTNVFQKLLQCGANPNGETNHGKKLIAYCIENPTAKEFLNMLLQVCTFLTFKSRKSGIERHK